MFITWLTACEEARMQKVKLNAKFRQDIIDKLPEQDDPIWNTYIEPRPSSTLKQRTEALWGIRVAFTHADGEIDLINDARNKEFAENSPKHIPGVRIFKGKLDLSGCNLHTPIRTVVQIRDVLP